MKEEAGRGGTRAPQGTPPRMTPQFPADVTVTRLSSSIHLYCQSDPPGSLGPRPLLLLLPWLGARPGAQAHYLALYLACGFDVLAVESSLRHFLCPCLGQRRAARVLALLGDLGALARRPLVVHALSLGGYTFAQMLLLMKQDPRRYGGVARRLWGHIFDSLVVGSLDHMALGVSQLMNPQALGPLVKATALLYFRLCPGCTVRHYDAAVDAFWEPPVRPPTLVFYSHDDPLCDLARLWELLASWQQAGTAVWAQAWETSRHAAHLRLHPKDYRDALLAFLGRLGLAVPPARL
ncbi:transmembrane protein 53-B-like [Erinaceus europaeus]|uniref:Transmembrane protein 53-B-like n=1 Tax=Erinaceus europaeus TaxID=9365 RepID=A0A1S3WFG3_ERIEU|nr:transmembrane protein 53-B-like [Erinaceus europaeus]